MAQQENEIRVKAIEELNESLKPLNSCIDAFLEKILECKERLKSSLSQSENKLIKDALTAIIEQIDKTHSFKKQTNDFYIVKCEESLSYFYYADFIENETCFYRRFLLPLLKKIKETNDSLEVFNETRILEEIGNILNEESKNIARELAKFLLAKEKNRYTYFAGAILPEIKQEQNLWKTIRRFLNKEDKKNYFTSWIASKINQAFSKKKSDLYFAHDSIKMTTGISLLVGGFLSFLISSIIVATVPAVAIPLMVTAVASFVITLVGAFLSMSEPRQIRRLSQSQEKDCYQSCLSEIFDSVTVRAEEKSASSSHLYITEQCDVKVAGLPKMDNAVEEVSETGSYNNSISFIPGSRGKTRDYSLKIENNHCSAAP